MDNKEEYHDPDYPGLPASVSESVPKLSEEEKIEKIKNIVHREFNNELKVRENEIKLIDQRASTARRLLHRLRYNLVSSYYREQKLQLTTSQIQDEIAAQHEPRARTEVSSMLRDGQRRIHPSVRKLLGKQSVDLDELLRTREPRNKARKDYSAMIQTRNYTISADKTKSLRPETQTEPSLEECLKPKKVPRRMDPKVDNVLTLDEITRNKMKHRYRIIIGNTSKYAPAASQVDRSTHKWLLYIRGPPRRPALAALLTAVTVRLHHSYAPHHTVHLQKPPFHISRRGWGEFPAKVELHFTLPERNRPATVEHTIKLDRNYTGLQTLGAETIVDVWLYSTHEMLEYEYKEDMDEQSTVQKVTNVPEAIEYKEEIITDVSKNDNKTDNWMDFFTTETTELDVDEMIIKPVKKPKLDEKNDTEAETPEIKQVKLDDQEILAVHKPRKLDARNDVHLNSNNIDKDHIKKEPKEMDYNIGETFQEAVNGQSMWNDAVQKVVENLPNEILNQQISTKKRIMKYMDPTTGKIYYLEMDRNLDLSKVQEIVINSKGQLKTAKISPVKTNGLKNIRKNKGVSLLKPDVKKMLKNDPVKKEKQVKKVFTHIENDHCYLGGNWDKEPDRRLFSEENNDVANEVSVKKETSLYNRVCSAVARFNNVRVSVNYLLRKIPLISDQARDPDFLRLFPFVVENDERYWRLDFAKRRNIEWSRAKLINTILKENCKITEQIWRTKQILIFARLHGYYPVRQDNILKQHEPNDEWTSWNDIDSSRALESNIKEIYPHATDISTLTIFSSETFLNSTVESINLTDSDEEIDIVKCELPVKIKKEVLSESNIGLSVLPVENEDDRLRFIFIEKKCSEIGIDLRNEDIGSGYCYSAVHAVLLSAMKNFAEDIIRSSLAARSTNNVTECLPPVWTGRPSSSLNRPLIQVQHVYQAVTASATSTYDVSDSANQSATASRTASTFITSASRLHILGARDLATNRKQTHSI